MAKRSGLAWLVAAAMSAAVVVGTAGGASGQGAKPDAAALEEADKLGREVVRLYADGRYDEAIPLAERELGMREKALGPDHANVATSLNNLAGLYVKKGDEVRAELLYQRALAIREKVLGPDHADVASSLNNLAMLYKKKDDYAQAEVFYQRSLAIKEKVLGPDHLDVATSLNNFAALYELKGDFMRAEPLYQRALAIREKVLGLEHPAVATLLINLARVYAVNGDHARAEPLYQRALVIRERELGPQHAAVAAIYSDMALSFAAQGRLLAALSFARQATDIQDHNAWASLLVGSEEQKRLFMNTLEDQTHQDISLHLQYAPTNSDAARTALTAILRRKGRVLEVMTDSLAALRRSLAPPDQILLDNFAFVHSQLATLLSQGPGLTHLDQYRESVAELEQERQKLEEDIGARNAAFRLENRLLTREDVQLVIPKGAALLEIARYEPIQFPSLQDPKPKRNPRYAAYVLRSSGDPTFVDLGDAAPLESAIKKLRHALSDPDLTHDPKPAARVLDRLLMQPIRELLEDTSWVFVSADGPLHLVPFAALVDENNQYLIKNYLFSYINTGRDLLRFTDKPAPHRQEPLVLANPAFDDSSASSTPEATHRGLRSIDMVTQRLLPLGGTTQEANTIRELFPDSQVLLGADATEKALKSAHAPRILHLATHGFFLPEQPVPEVLLHRQGSEPTPAERAAILQRENPLLRSGIALAGFNRRQSGKDDGVLTALEAASLDLHGTRLVVLSACETGVGQPSSGEGVYGLRRALAMAGAETQVMSLWQVDTGRTRELMQAYYKRLKENDGRSGAMRDVQLAMLNNRETSHPNLWASFIVSGDWQALEGKNTRPYDNLLARVVFPLSLGTDYGFPLGNASDFMSQSEFISGQVSLVLDYGAKFKYAGYFGTYVGIGFGGAGSMVGDRCNEMSASCLSYTLRIGFDFQHDFFARTWLNAYMGLGLGYEYAAVGTGIQGVPPQSFHGFELARFTLGADYHPSSAIAFGPYMNVGVGTYVAMADGSELVNLDPAVHTWVRIGLRATKVFH